jgi:hypothetical protein
MRTPSCPIRPRQGRAAGRAASAGKQQSIQRRMAATREADKLIEEATVDCYNEEEQASGLFTAIDENLALPFATQVLGVEVAVVAVEMDDDSSLKAVCERGGDRQRIDLTDLPLPSLQPSGAEWIAVYRRWLHRRRRDLDEDE